MVVKVATVVGAEIKVVVACFAGVAGAAAGAAVVVVIEVALVGVACFDIKVELGAGQVGVADAGAGLNWKIHEEHAAYIDAFGGDRTMSHRLGEIRRSRLALKRARVSVRVSECCRRRVRF